MLFLNFVKCICSPAGVLYFFYLSFSNIAGYAQNFETIDNTKFFYNEGLRLFNEKKYSAAQNYFDRLIHKEQMVGFDELTSDAEYFGAICALELDNQDAGARISRFIENHPGNPRILMAHFQMGRYYYKKQEYTLADKWFNKVTRRDLNSDQLAEFFFKKGYCAYMTDNKELAERMFYELLDFPKSEFYDPGVYFYAHLEYEKQNYQTALEGFEKLAESETFQPITPYYIAQIYFMQQRYENAIDYISQWVSKVSPTKIAEMKRILGESYFRLENYDSAARYLEDYRNITESTSRYDIYHLAYAQYKLYNYEKAAGNFNLVTNMTDTLAQSAYYLLGDCYLKMNDKKNAHLAFGNAWKLEFSPEIQEDALFNYSKLTYELSFAAFNETIKNFETYLEKFPNSTRRDEIFDYLVKVYLTGKNYREALASIARIKDKNRTIDNALQRTTFYYGVELFTNLNFFESADMFQQSINSQGDDIKMRANATYWLAEAYLRQNKLGEALPQYIKYLETPGSYGTKEYRLSNYNVGYIYFKQKNYADAVKWFNQYIERPANDPKFLIDTYSRTGDSYFAQRQFDRAITSYDKVLQNQPLNEYAHYQKGISYGLVGQQEAKIKELSFFYDQPSIYADAAVFEIGNAYTRLSNNTEAIKSYQYIVSSYPNSLLVAKSQLQSGLLAFNLGDNQRAIDYLKKVVEKYPATPEAVEAMNTLRNVYLEVDEVDTYLNFAKAVNGGKGVSSSEQDSLTFLAAERIYISGDYRRSALMFTEYAEKFPYGQFLSHAQFYKGQSELKSADSTQALASFYNVISMPRNVYTVQALYQVATINVRQKEYANALNAYQQLMQVADVPEMLTDAKIGVMRCNAHLKQYEKAIAAADEVLKISVIPQENQTEATYIRATSYFELKNYDKALVDYQTLSGNTRIAEGAEAKYRMAQIAFNSKLYDLAETRIMNFINDASPHYLWTGKSFMLLATIYKQKGDSFQAKAYLQSLLDNYPAENDGIKAAAADSLATIIQTENRTFDGSQQDEVIDIGRN